MTQIPFHFDIVESDQQLKVLMMREIAKELNARIPRAMPDIVRKMRAVTIDHIQQTPTYRSLVAGDLAVHFGLPAGDRHARVDTILAAIANRMEITYSPITTTGSKFQNGISFRVLLTNLSEVLTLPEAIVTTEKGQRLPWLSWLVEMGDSFTIDEYDVSFEPGKGRSRGGVMVKDAATSWRVPPQFSGTLSDNWFTRALVTNYPIYSAKIESILQSELQRI